MRHSNESLRKGLSLIFKVLLDSSLEKFSETFLYDFVARNTVPTLMQSLYGVDKAMGQGLRLFRRDNKIVATEAVPRGHIERAIF